MIVDFQAEYNPDCKMIIDDDCIGNIIIHRIILLLASFCYRYDVGGALQTNKQTNEQGKAEEKKPA